MLTYTNHCLTKLQAKELELLKNFIQICEDLHLQYFLVCGSALGAVKYQGFIPWDDDIDVALFRKDYEVFISEAPNMLPPNMFLQNTYTEPAVPFIYTKLRDSNTTFIEKSSSDLPINQGIFIDIFPLDGYPSRKSRQVWMEVRKKFFTYLLYTNFSIDRHPCASIVNSALCFLGAKRHTAQVIEKYTQMISRYKIDDSTLICNHGNWQGKQEYAEKEQYGQGTLACFEKLQVCIPQNYNAYLSQKYGDWRADLPDEQKRGHHSYLICDTEQSYLKYVEE